MDADLTLQSMALEALERIRQTPSHVLLLFLLSFCCIIIGLLYGVLCLVAPEPRPPRPSEKKYRTILANGQMSEPLELPCWYDRWRARKEAGQKSKESQDKVAELEEPELFMSVVVPAFNEEERLGGMLEEAVEFLQREYGDAHQSSTPGSTAAAPSSSSKKAAPKGKPVSAANGSADHHTAAPRAERGWEILVVSDGSTDRTVETALKFAREHQLERYPRPVKGPWSSHKAKTRRASQAQQPATATHIPHGSIRVVALEENRGKGGAVTHGMRHIRGRYVVFADADGASKFDDLASLVAAAREIEDGQGRALAIGSRAHLVGSEAVVKRSALRNLLMRAFHLFIRTLTPPATSRVADTQCGFKLFSRPALPAIVPYMHMQGWIFDVEMLMLAESARIPMKEVPVGWKEVTGSKLNVVWDSIGMAWGLAVLRAAWAAGVYRRW